jgi:hypothetical protein
MPRPDEMGGVGACGATAPGRFNVDGNARNLDMIVATGGSILVECDWDGDTEDTHRLVAYVSGELTATAAIGERIQLGPFPSGDVEVAVFPVRLSETISQVRGDLTGGRPYLRWPRSTETDVRAYRAYWNEGGGDADTLLAELATVRAELFEGKDGGSGGRASLRGSYDGPAANGVYSLTLDTAETWEVTFGGQTYAGAVIPGSAVMLFGGLVLQWLDGPDAYDTGDTWPITIGPPSYYIGAQVDPGDYQFAVSAVDAAGNESALSAEVPINVPALPAPPGNPSIVFIPGGPAFLVTFDAPAADVAAIRAYSNYNLVTDEIEPFILENGPMNTLSVEGGGLECGAARGEVLFYLRSVNGDGVEEENCNLIRVMALDVLPASLAAPAITAVRPAVGGKVSASWQTDVTDATPTWLRWYVSTSASWDDATEDGQVAFDGVGTPSASGTWTSEGTYSGTVYVGVRAEDAEGLLTPQGSLVAVTADSTAPAAPSITIAWP